MPSISKSGANVFSLPSFIFVVEFLPLLTDNSNLIFDLVTLAAMKVMRLLSSLKHDESERGIFHLGRALVKNGHTSIIVSSADEENDLVKRLKRDGNHYHQLHMNKKSWLSLLRVNALRHLIEKYDPDVIHLHSRTPAWILHLALRRTRLKRMPKLVSTMYGFYPINKYSQALLDVDVMITVSDSVTNYLKKGLRREDAGPKVIKRIYRGVDTRRYPYRHNPSVYWLRHTFAEYPELEHKKWLVFPTVIGNEYGQEWLIDILGNLQNFPIFMSSSWTMIIEMVTWYTRTFGSVPIHLGWPSASPTWVASAMTCASGYQQPISSWRSPMSLSLLVSTPYKRFT